MEITMENVYWFSLIFNLIVFIPVTIFQERKNDGETEYFEGILYCVFAAIFPFLNTIIMIFGSLVLFIQAISKIFVHTRKKTKERKYPEIKVINLLEDIYRYYESECKNNKMPKEIKDFKKKLESLVKFLNNNHQKTNVPNLLFTYEPTFEKILNAFKSSEDFNDTERYAILSTSQNAIEMFKREIKQIKSKSAEIEEFTEKTLTNRLIEELENDRLYHQTSDLKNRKEPN